MNETFKYAQPVVIKAQVKFGQDIVVKDYTAKLVKSLLITGNPRLEEVFRKDRGMPPKPIHITPLYVRDKQGVRAVYAKAIPKGFTAKPPKPERLEPVKVKEGEKYLFYIGVSLGLLEDVLLGLSNVGRFYFGREIVDVDSLSYEIHYVDLEKKSQDKRVVLEGETTKRSRRMKVVFSSPTLLKDPLVIMRKKKKKLFLPLPEAVFSTPLLMALIDEGRLRRGIFLRSMRYVKSIFDTPYTALKTVNLVWYVYDGEVLPAMIGYVKYYVDVQLLAYAEAVMNMKYGLDFVGLISKALILAQVYGIGDSRATGFGHVLITTS